MGFLDMLSGIVKSVMEGEPAAAVNAEPEVPTAFGWRTAWLAVKADSPEQVIEKLGITGKKASGWTDGLKASKEDGQVFVTQPMNGYVLVIGVTPLADNMSRLDAIAGKFGELQFFGTHDIVDLQCWAKFVNGAVVRRYSFLGESGKVLFNEGEITAEEREIGLDNLIAHEDDDWETVTLPTEDTVLELAGKWSLDTTFEQQTFPPQTGFTGNWK